MMDQKSAREQEEINRRVLTASVDHIYESLHVVNTAYLFFLCLVLWALWDEFPGFWLLGWFAAACLFHLYRYYLYLAYYQGGRERRSPTYWGRTFARSTMYQGTIWGFLALVLFPHQSAALQVFVISLVVAISVSFLALAPYWNSNFYAFALPANGMLGLRLVEEGGDHIITALAIGIFTALASVYAMRAGGTVREAIRLRYENEALVRQIREEKEKAEEASRVKTRFLAAASHDLRQPVHSLALLTEALHGDVLTERGKGLLQQLNDVADNLSGLLSSLLDISRLDAGIVRAIPSVVPLERLTRALRNEFRATAREKGLLLRMHGCRGTVTTDQDLLMDILRNLLSNAIRYTRYGGVLLACRKRGDDVLIQVWDTGIGIPESERESVFHEFNQLNNPERDRGKGLGLGLAICQRLTKLLGYSLTLRSRVGRGTVFELRLPGANGGTDNDCARESRPGGTGVESRLAGYTVMVIDDERTVRESTAALLQSWGMVVSTADGLEQAIEHIASGNRGIDVILADFRLRGGITGATVIARLREDIGRHVPGIIITGDTTPERIREATDSGCTLLHKPIKPAQLRAELRKHCKDAKKDRDVRPL